MAAQLAGSPYFLDRIERLSTEQQRSVTFYMSWYGRCFRSGENGWFPFQTPDGMSIIDQDAFFWNCLETIARKLNEQIALERSKSA